MSENRELTMDDYLAMLRRRLKVILIPALLAPLAGFMVSYVFPPTYKSQATVLVEGQRVPDSLVQPVITSMSAAASASPSGKKKKPSSTSEPVPGFNVSYTDSNAVRAQKICEALTELIVNENLKSRDEVAKSTTDFL